MKRLGLSAIALLSALPAWGQLGVQIVDYPPRVHAYSPIVVTVRVTNHGKKPLLIPASGHSESRHFLQFGPTRENLSIYEPIFVDGGGTATWLEPSASWLFQVDIGRHWTHNVPQLFVAAGIESTGRCQYETTGREPVPLKLVFETTGIRRYECWSGREISSVERVDIVDPVSETDREALDYYLSPEFYRGRPDAGHWAGIHLLLERFPTSSITFAVGFQECALGPGCLQQLLGLQSAHPLAKYMRLQLALSLLEAGRGAEVTTAYLKSLELPDVLTQYVLQKKRETNERKRAAMARATPDTVEYSKRGAD